MPECRSRAMPGGAFIGVPDMAIESINPATGETLEIYAQMPRAEVDEIVGKAHEAFLVRPGARWRARPARC
jgi:acyl-CoA reductase-like NAD-dependent aldehyde dehydrogenase